MSASSHSADPAEKNVRVIARLERVALSRRTAAARFSDAITHFSGTMTFVVLHVVWFTVWIAINTGFWKASPPFDPFPFPFLTLVVSLEAILLSTFILITQNRMTHHADQRAHLDLQINLLAEQENTRMLRVLRAICEKLEIKFDNEETAPFEEDTNIATLVKELEQTLEE
jgi:uncharacterized membrane protein